MFQTIVCRWLVKWHLYANLEVWCSFMTNFFCIYVPTVEGLCIGRLCFDLTGPVHLAMQCLSHLRIRRTSCPVSVQVVCYHHIQTYRVLGYHTRHLLQRVNRRIRHLPHRVRTLSNNGKCSEIIIHSIWSNSCIIMRCLWFINFFCFCSHFYLISD